MKMIKKIILGLVVSISLSSCNPCYFMLINGCAETPTFQNESDIELQDEETYTELNDSTNTLVPNDLI
jgi:hypothetical protein